jgi:hypothetical protein
MVFSRLLHTRALVSLGLGIGLALLLVLTALTNVHPALASGGACNCTFVQTTTTANTTGDYTFLNNALTADDPNAVLFVTPNLNPNGVITGIDTHQVGVRYDNRSVSVGRFPLGVWTIFNEDGSPMPIGVSFNVMALSTSVETFTLTATAATPSSLLYINDPISNGNPQFSLLVTQNGGADGLFASGGISNDHPIGVYYDPSAQEWLIYNEDGSPIPTGAAFNIATFGSQQVATVSNTSGSATCLTGMFIASSVPVFVTHQFSGYFTDVAAVWWDQSLGTVCIFGASRNPMPLGATFSYVAGP